MQKLAVIDLGSNSIRMSIFEINPNLTFAQTHSFRSMIKLSEGMTGDMNLTPAAQLRAVKALLEYKQILKTEKVENIRAVATAAVRKAKNRNEFLALVEDTTNIKIEVIGGDTEAALDCLAVSKLLGVSNGVICDIGGGSTEFIALIDGKIQKPAISIPMGSRSLTEDFFAKGETAESIDEATNHIKNKISTIPWLDKMQGAPIIGIGGTLRSLAKYHLADSTKAAISHHKISAPECDRICDEIMHATHDERLSFPGIGAERADIIAAGILTFLQLKKALRSPQLQVADIGIREGLLFEYLEKLSQNE